MKKILVRGLSLLICLATVISCFSFATSAEKVTYRNAANGVSSAYKNSKFYKNLTQIELTGDGRTDVLAVALSQVGYLEGTNENGFNGSQGGGGNYTEYTYNMGKVGSYSYAWCAAFVSWSLLQSRCTDQNTQGAWCRNHEGDKNYIWREVGCYRWYNQLKRFGYGHAANSGYTPKSGDLVFFETSEHIGIVRYSKNGMVYTIEGNTSKSGFNSEGGGVFCKEYKITGGAIRGFGELPYKTNAKAMKVDYSGENPTTGLWIGETDKYLYPDTKMSDSSNYSVIPKGSAFEVIEIVNKTCFKAKFDGKTGYVNVNNTSKIYQITSSNPPEPPVVKNTYYISKDIKKISGHFGSGIDKYYVDTKGSTKVKDPYELNAGQQVGIAGFAGFDSFAKEYGYYFDDNKESVVWGSKPIDADAEAKKKGGDKTSEFKIMASTDALTNGEHTVTFMVKLLNKKEHPLITLNLNISGANPNAGQATQAPETQAPVTQAPVTQAPETQPIETLPPETQAPITQLPETEIVTDPIIDTDFDDGCADATQAPATQAPATQAPVTQAPVTQAPVTQAPVTQYPQTQYPQTQYPVTDIPTSGATDTQPMETPEIGCGATAAVAVIMPTFLAAGFAMLKKKKED